MNLDTVLGIGSLLSAAVFAIAYVPVKQALVDWTGAGVGAVAIVLILLIVIQLVSGTRLLRRARSA